MPEPTPITKATLQPVRPTKDGRWLPKDLKEGAIAVQFNPQTLKVNYSNQKASGDQPKGAAVQYLGKGATKLTCELIFDITMLETGTGQHATDVRSLTKQVSQFMKPEFARDVGKGKAKEAQYLPPAVRFAWGTFVFEGVMDSVDETLEFFSSTGVPLRATVAISMTQQDIALPAFPAQTTGTTPLTPASQPNLQNVAGKDYKAVGAANGFENLRAIPAGSLIDLSANVGVAASVGLNAGLEAPLGGSIGIGGSLGIGGGSLGIGGSIGIGGGLSGEGEISFR